jgi:hypothetical protein
MRLLAGFVLAAILALPTSGAAQCLGCVTKSACGGSGSGVYLHCVVVGGVCHASTINRSCLKPQSQLIDKSLACNKTDRSVRLTTQSLSLTDGGTESPAGTRSVSAAHASP